MLKCSFNPILSEGSVASYNAWRFPRQIHDGLIGGARLYDILSIDSAVQYPLHSVATSDGTVLVLGRAMFTILKVSKMPFYVTASPTYVLVKTEELGFTIERACTSDSLVAVVTTDGLLRILRLDTTAQSLSTVYSAPIGEVCTQPEGSSKVPSDGAAAPNAGDQPDNAPSSSDFAELDSVTFHTFLASLQQLSPAASTDGATSPSSKSHAPDIQVSHIALSDRYLCVCTGFRLFLYEHALAPKLGEPSSEAPAAAKPSAPAPAPAPTLLWSSDLSPYFLSSRELAAADQQSSLDSQQPNQYIKCTILEGDVFVSAVNSTVPKTFIYSLGGRDSAGASGRRRIGYFELTLPPPSLRHSSSASFVSATSFAVSPFIPCLLAIGLSYGEVLLLDSRTFKMVNRFAISISPVISIAFSPTHANVLLAASCDRLHMLRLGYSSFRILEFLLHETYLSPAACGAAFSDADAATGAEGVLTLSARRQTVNHRLEPFPSDVVCLAADYDTKNILSFHALMSDGRFLMFSLVQSSQTLEWLRALSDTLKKYDPDYVSLPLRASAPAPALSYSANGASLVPDAGSGAGGVGAGARANTRSASGNSTSTSTSPIASVLALAPPEQAGPPSGDIVSLSPETLALHLNGYLSELKALIQERNFAKAFSYAFERVESYLDTLDLHDDHGRRSQWTLLLDHSRRIFGALDTIKLYIMALRGRDVGTPFGAQPFRDLGIDELVTRFSLRVPLALQPACCMVPSDIEESLYFAVETRLTMETIRAGPRTPETLKAMSQCINRAVRFVSQMSIPMYSPTKLLKTILAASVEYAAGPIKPARIAEDLIKADCYERTLDNYFMRPFMPSVYCYYGLLNFGEYMRTVFQDVQGLLCALDPPAGGAGEGGAGLSQVQVQAQAQASGAASASTPPSALQPSPTATATATTTESPRGDSPGPEGSDRSLASAQKTVRSRSSKQVHADLIVPLNIPLLRSVMLLQHTSFSLNKRECDANERFSRHNILMTAITQDGTPPSVRIEQIICQHNKLYNMLMDADNTPLAEDILAIFGITSLFGQASTVIQFHSTFCTGRARDVVGFTSGLMERIKAAFEAEVATYRKTHELTQSDLAALLATDGPRGHSVDSLDEFLRFLGIRPLKPVPLPAFQDVLCPMPFYTFMCTVIYVFVWPLLLHALHTAQPAQLAAALADMCEALQTPVLIYNIALNESNARYLLPEIRSALDGRKHTETLIAVVQASAQRYVSYLRVAAKRTSSDAFFTSNRVLSIGLRKAGSFLSTLKMKKSEVALRAAADAIDSAIESSR